MIGRLDAAAVNRLWMSTTYARCRLRADSLVECVCMRFLSITNKTDSRATRLLGFFHV